MAGPGAGQVMGMHQVVYYSRSGNTRKVAEAMAGELGVAATPVEEAELGQGDGVLLLGSGCYGGRPSPVVLDLIRASDLEGRRVALFGTSGGGQGQELEEMGRVVEARGATVVGRYHCKGRTFGLVSRGHPSSEDLSRARRFALETTGGA